MDTTQHISLAEAFAHCASTTSYWLWIGISLAFVIGGSYIWYKVAQKTEVNGFVKIFLAFAFLAAILCSIFLRPTDVAQNTSRAAAARGHYLGY